MTGRFDKEMAGDAGADPAVSAGRAVALVLLFVFPGLATWLPEAIGW